MQPMFRLITLGTLLALVLPVSVPAQATDPRNGTWELNLAKSKYSAGQPAPTSAMRTYDIAGQSIKFVSKGMDAQGKPTSAQYAAIFDGKDYPLTGSADSDAISLKRTGGNTFEATQKKGGKVVITTTNMVSQDGKLMTVTSKGTTAAGQTFNTVAVYDKR